MVELGIYVSITAAGSGCTKRLVAVFRCVPELAVRTPISNSFVAHIQSEELLRMHPAGSIDSEILPSILNRIVEEFIFKAPTSSGLFGAYFRPRIGKQARGRLNDVSHITRSNHRCCETQISTGLEGKHGFPDLLLNGAKTHGVIDPEGLPTGRIDRLEAHWLSTAVGAPFIESSTGSCRIFWPDTTPQRDTGPHPTVAFRSSPRIQVRGIPK